MDRRHRERFLRAVRLTTLWAALTAATTSLVFFLSGEVIIGWFTGVDEVIATAREYLVWMVLAPVVSCWSFQLDGLFIGTGHTREMRNAMFFSLIAYLALLQWTVPSMGNHGLFLGLSIFMLIRALSLLFYYRGIEAVILKNETAQR